jgi:hypothetical protein
LAQASRLNQVPTITYQVRRGANSTPQLDVIEMSGVQRDMNVNQLRNHQELNEKYDYQNNHNNHHTSRTYLPKASISRKTVVKKQNGIESNFLSEFSF